MDELILSLIITCVWEAVHNSLRKLHKPGRANLNAAIWNNSSALADNTQHTLAALTPNNIPLLCVFNTPLLSTISATLASFWLPLFPLIDEAFCRKL